MACSSGASLVRVVESGRLVGILVHDHLIVAGDAYTSLAGRGLM